jgi:acyl-CoA hydrolase
VIDLAGHLPPGAGVFYSEACAEPTPLVHALLDQQEGLGGEVRAFVGLSYDDELTPERLGRVQLVSYGALGTVARIARAGALEVVPCHYSALPRLFAERLVPGDVALVQVAPAGADGRHSLGIGTSYIADALAHARVVIAEVNARMPATEGPSIAAERLAATIHTDRPLLEPPAAAPGERERRIAAHVAELVRDGDTLQMGVGPLPDAIVAGLAGHRDLGMHSGMVTDGVLDLVEAGVITGARKEIDTGRVVTGAALGSARLNAGVAAGSAFAFRPASYTHDAGVLAGLRRLVSINAAIEVDLLGQVNAETIAGVHRGALGGQADFSRAAARAEGRSIIALPSTAGARSRIVARLADGVVTTPRSDIDVVVTEHGAAHLRGRSVAARRRALLAVADPAHRERLAQADPRD